MDKAKGFTAGAVVIAGMLLRPFGLLSSGAPATSIEQRAGVETSVQEPPAQGPWIASCKYWAPARQPVEPASGQAGFEVEQAPSESGRNEKRSPPLTPAASSSCAGGTDRWGIPPTVDGLQPSITAIIAAVPDPLRAHMALQFDRAIDALVQAAADNGYVESYFWIPWRTSMQRSQAPETTKDPQSTENREREREPGLIVLKHVPPESKEERPGASYNQVIYLFLVRNTPVLGMDGDEMGRAIRYEKELATNHTGVVKFSRQDDTDFALIASNASGSAASTREGINLAQQVLQIKTARVAGGTSTDLAKDIYSHTALGNGLTYISFGSNTSFSQGTFLSNLHAAGYDWSRVAFVVEDGTTFGQTVANNDARTQQPLTIRFPRGISLLRNAQTEQQKGSDSNATQGPYLHLSLSDTSIEDTLPRFSTGQSPVSQEAQLLATFRQLHRLRIQFVIIYASDVLDEIFLAKSIHQAVPDVRLVSLGGGDLLYEREIDNVPFVGAVTISPYNLVAPVSSNGTATVRAFSDSESQTLYNAASYIFWDGKDDPLRLAGYHNVFDPAGELHASLWATLIGRDGYYPMALLDECASDDSVTLPAFQANPNGAVNPRGATCDASKVSSAKPSLHPFHVTPPLGWFAWCALVCILCIAHTSGLLASDLWSPFTRDLAIDRNDEPCRRAIYIHIGTAMLFCMAVVVAYPLFAALRIIHPLPSARWAAGLTLLAGTVAYICSFHKTWRHIFPRGGPPILQPNRKAPVGKRSFWEDVRLYRLFHLIALLATIMIPSIWIINCGRCRALEEAPYVKLFFSYRCLNPISGVSPALPVLLLLGAWYIWSIFQTRRLRFSEASRPRLPGRTSAYTYDKLYVPDEALAGNGAVQRTPLYDTITCLLITPDFLHRAFPKASRAAVNAVLSASYFGLFVLCLACGRINSPECILWPHHFLTTYELLVQTLFFPLMMITLTGWLRLIVTWGALSRGLLRPLEQRPIRFAFGRLSSFGWLSLLRQNGLVHRWREMARSTEAMRQMRHIPEFAAAFALPHAPTLDPDMRTRPISGNGSGTPLTFGPLPQAYTIDPANKDPHVEAGRPLAYATQAVAEASKPAAFHRARTFAPLPQAYTIETPEDRYTVLMGHINQLQELVKCDSNVKQPLYWTGRDDALKKRLRRQSESPCTDQDSGVWDLPDKNHEAELLLTDFIEHDYAEFSEALLQHILIPYWRTECSEFVETEQETIAIAAKRKPAESGQSAESVDVQVRAGSTTEERIIQLAEEFVAIRYISMIRAVLVNLRHLMTFVSIAFVLTIISWNSYPFRPRTWVNASLTTMLVIIGGGVIWVFAQIHRDPILSRITRTVPNELGSDFYLRIAGFGAVPLLTWLAYQFPSVSEGILRYLQPGVQATLK